jgi:hypothetical protein
MSAGNYILSGLRYFVAEGMDFETNTIKSFE